MLDRSQATVETSCTDEAASTNGGLKQSKTDQNMPGAHKGAVMVMVSWLSTYHPASVDGRHIDTSASANVVLNQRFIRFIALLDR
jgi:hypothetical protein